MGKKLTISFLILVIAEVIYNISGYFIHAGLGHFLGPAEYGRYSIVIGITTMMIILIGRGVPTAMAKRISEFRGDWQKIHAIKSATATLQFLIISTLTILFYFSAPLMAHALGDPSLIPLFQLSSLIIPTFSISSFHVLYFNGLKAFGAMSAMKITRGLFRALWIVGLAQYFFTTGAIFGAVLAPLSVAFIALIIDYLFVTKKSKKLSYKDTVHYPWRNLMSYARGFMLFLFFYEFYIRVDLYLIKSLLHDDVTTGLYAAAMTIALIPYYAIFALTFILFPTISELVKKKDWRNVRKILRRVFSFLAFSLPIATIILVSFGSNLIVLLFGASFASAGSLITLLLGGSIFGTLFYVLASILNGAGHTHVTATITGIAIIATILLNFIFLPIYGIHVTALIFSSTSFFMGTTASFFVYTIFYKNKNTP